MLEERNKFEWVVEHAQDGYLIISDEGEIRYANKEARFYLNLPLDPREPVTKTFQEIVSEKYRCEPQAAWIQAAWPKQSTSAEVSPRYLIQPESPTANSFWLQVDLHRINLPSNSAMDWMIRLRDVTP